jgi:hypothetical protein
LQPLLLRGDLVLTRGRSWLSGAIREGQRRAGIDKYAPAVNHVAGVVEDGFPAKVGLARVVESDKKIRAGNLVQYHARDMVWVYRPLNIPFVKLNDICAEVEGKIGEEYGYVEFLPQWLDSKLFSGRVVLRHLSPIIPGVQCSTLWACAYATQGYTFGKARYAPSPAEVERFVLGNPDKYRLIWSGVPNEWIEESVA